MKRLSLLLSLLLLVACLSTQVYAETVYFLVGESEEGKQQVYIGESENCGERISQHNKNKDFWQYALVNISKTKFFTKAHGQYLEYYCIDQAQKAGRYALENGNSGKKTHVSEPVAADLLDNFEDIKVLCSALGYKIFDAMVRPVEKDILYCKGKGAVGKGQYGEDGFTVFKGSTCSIKYTNSCHKYSIAKREKMIEDGILQEKDGFYVLTEDYIFNSPSTAAMVVMAGNANGWITWKYKDGRTLDEVKRQGE